MGTSEDENNGALYHGLKVLFQCRVYFLRDLFSTRPRKQLRPSGCWMSPWKADRVGLINLSIAESCVIRQSVQNSGNFFGSESMTFDNRIAFGGAEGERRGP